jgi:hypothetical protein
MSLLPSGDTGGGGGGGDCIISSNITVLNEC